MKEKWIPTSDNINALPDGIRDYVHHLETMCDPSGLVQENVLLKDNMKMLLALNYERENAMSKLIIEVSLVRRYFCLNDNYISTKTIVEYPDPNDLPGAKKVFEEVYSKALEEIREND